MRTNPKFQEHVEAGEEWAVRASRKPKARVDVSDDYIREKFNSLIAKPAFLLKRGDIVKPVGSPDVGIFEVLDVSAKGHKLYARGAFLGGEGGTYLKTRVKQSSREKGYREYSWENVHFQILDEEMIEIYKQRLRKAGMLKD